MHCQSGSYAVFDGMFTIGVSWNIRGVPCDNGGSYDVSGFHRDETGAFPDRKSTQQWRMYLSGIG